MDASKILCPGRVKGAFCTFPNFCASTRQLKEWSNGARTSIIIMDKSSVFTGPEQVLSATHTAQWKRRMMWNWNVTREALLAFISSPEHKTPWSQAHPSILSSTETGHWNTAKFNWTKRTRVQRNLRMKSWW